MSQTWGLPHGAEVVGTVTSVDTFLGLLLKLSSDAYKNNDDRFDGSIDVTETDDKKSFNLNVTGDPYELDKKDEITLKVNSSTKPVLKKTVKRQKRTKSS